MIPARVHDWETTGESLPSAELLRLFVEAGISVDWLLGANVPIELREREVVSRTRAPSGTSRAREMTRADLRSAIYQFALAEVRIALGAERLGDATFRRLDVWGLPTTESSGESAPDSDLLTRVAAEVTRRTDARLRFFLAQRLRAFAELMETRRASRRHARLTLAPSIELDALTARKNRMTLLVRADRLVQSPELEPLDRYLGERCAVWESQAALHHTTFRVPGGLVIAELADLTVARVARKRGDDEQVLYFFTPDYLDIGRVQRRSLVVTTPFPAKWHTWSATAREKWRRQLTTAAQERGAAAPSLSPIERLAPEQIRLAPLPPDPAPDATA